MVFQSLLPQWLTGRNNLAPQLRGQAVTNDKPIADGKLILHDQIFMLGDVRVGKSTLVRRWCRGGGPPSLETNNLPAFGIEFGYHHKQTDSFNISAEIWNISGDPQRILSLPAVAPRLTGMFLVYDMTNRKSFSNIKNWLMKLEALQRRNLAAVMLLANKTNLAVERVISFDEGQEFAQLNGLHFMEVSCADSSSIKETIEQELSLIHDFYKLDHPFKTNWSSQDDLGRSSRTYQPLGPEQDSLAKVPFYNSYLKANTN